MQKLLICGVLALVLTVSTRAQATFALYNYDPAYRLDAPIFDSQGLPLGTNYLAELYGGATPNLLVPAQPRIAVPFSTNVAAGYFGTWQAVEIPGIAGNEFAWLDLKQACLGRGFRKFSNS